MILYRQAVEEKEKETLRPIAALSENHERFEASDEDYRLPYRRDVERIIHSKAYARYADKTQVVYLVKNDHVTHRGLHVQFVSCFARGIAEILGLNTDLVEAIALGHDVGHPPFGHEGEGYLSALSKEYGNGLFSHPWQSCRLLSLIEPLNLGLNVYDGFLCHDGAMNGRILHPKFGKNWDDHFAEKELKIKNPEGNFQPATLEGCLVKICDTMNYVGKDIEDAIDLGILKREEVPVTHLGVTNRDILNNLAVDLIENSYDRDYIAISQNSFDALKILRSFNFKKIYTHPHLKIESHKVKKSYRILFETLLNGLLKEKEQSYVWTYYASTKSENYLSSTNEVQMVVDYISGMTDNFFVATLEKTVIPMRIEIDR